MFITRPACDLIKIACSSDGLFDHMAFIADVGVEHLLQQCHTVTRSILQKYVPIKSKKITASGFLLSWYCHDCAENDVKQYSLTKITPKPPNPLMTMEIQSAKHIRQKLERVSRMTRIMPRYISRYRNQANLCNTIMRDVRRRYYTDCINETSDNPRTLWKTINNILHRTQSPSIPAFLLYQITFSIAFEILHWQNSESTYGFQQRRSWYTRKPISDSRITHDMFRTYYMWWKWG